MLLYRTYICANASVQWNHKNRTENMYNHMLNLSHSKTIVDHLDESVVQIIDILLK